MIPGAVPKHELDDADVVLLDDLDEVSVSVEGPLYRKEVVVKGGPPCWDGLSGTVDRDDGSAEVVVILTSSDDGGRAEFRVRMPRGMAVPAELAPKAKA